MDVRFINPFVESTVEVFQKMLAATVTRGNPVVSNKAPAGDELISIIGLSGRMRGAVVMQLPVATGLNIASRILMTEKEQVDADVYDAVAEFTNMIAGGAKAQLSRLEEDGAPITLGLPTVFHGQQNGFGSSSGALWLELPFESDLGKFDVLVSLESK